MTVNSCGQNLVPIVPKAGVALAAWGKRVPETEARGSGQDTCTGLRRGLWQEVPFIICTYILSYKIKYTESSPL